METKYDKYKNKARKFEPFIKSSILSINYWEYRKVHSKGTHNLNLLNNNSIKNSYLTYLSLNPPTNAAYCALQTETEKKLFAMKKLLLEPLCTEDQVLRKVLNYTCDNISCHARATNITRELQMSCKSHKNDRQYFSLVKQQYLSLFFFIFYYFFFSKRN